jgi:hypothetical protein
MRNTFSLVLLYLKCSARVYVCAQRQRAAHPYFALVVESGNQGDGRERWSQILLRRRAVLRECDREIEFGMVRLATTRSCDGAIARDRDSQSNHAIRTYLSTIIAVVDSLTFGRLAHTSRAGVFDRASTLRRRQVAGGSTLRAACSQRPASHRRRIYWVEILSRARRTVRCSPSLVALRESFVVRSGRHSIRRLGLHVGNRRPIWLGARWQRGSHLRLLGCDQ